ncbi:MAG TPA: 3'-5' exonuclease, partial [Macellibacteroides fermentans]|nr:3'-5' exonuclease [Macellibacteroides fermentans]
SDEALFISSSPAVRFLIALLRYLRNPGDRTNYRLALFAYTLAVPEADNASGGARDFIPLDEFPEELNRALHGLSNHSLYEMTEGLFRLFNDRFPDNEQVFVQALMDMVSEFTQRESVDISRFLQWWDDTGSRKTIATPDAQNAIRILTIHKSKGLGFKVVIVPFGDWEIDHKPSKQPVLWCHPDKTPFNQLHLVPVRYGSVLGNTIFADDYFNEKLHAFIDNLNTLYVAFTRSKEELIVFSPKPKKPEKISSMSDLLWNGLSTDGYDSTREGESLLPLASHFDSESAVFELGSWWHPEKKKNEDRPVTEIPMQRIHSVSPDDRLQLRLHGKGFFFDNKERKHGTLMHEVLSRIHTKADIRQAVEGYRVSGVINREEADVLCGRLDALLDKQLVAGWYDGTARILNEVDILYGKGLAKRPDRVMIYDDQVVVVDYKFGQKESKTYISQMKEYVGLIRQMDYKQVTGYIWYVELDKIEAV